MRWPLHPAALACLAVSVGLLCLLPVVPGADLPQHLACGRLFADLTSPSLPFRDFYASPPRLQPYDTVYLAVAALSRLASITTASRTIATGFAVLTFFAFQRLTDALHGRASSREPPVTTVFATLIVWSPTVFMGFLQFYLCVPLVLLALAEIVGAEGPRPRLNGLSRASGLAVAVACLHPMAAGALVVLAALYVILDRGRDAAPRRVVATAVIAVTVVTLALWRARGDVIGAGPHVYPWRDAIRDAQGLEFLNRIFGIVWHDPTMVVSYSAWTVLGPYRLAGLLPPLVVTLWLVHAVVKAPAALATPDRVRSYTRVALVFGGLALLSPWGIDVPDELLFINLRLIGLAAAIALPLVPPAYFDVTPARVRILAWTGVTIANLVLNLSMFAREAEAPLALIARADPRGVLLPIVFRGTSLRFAKTFRLTHHLPTLFTADRGGITTQFWARYTNHLPFGYLPGKQPDAPPDLEPALFDPEKHLRDVDWVLLEEADGDVGPPRRADALRVRRQLDERTELTAAAGLWRLYRVHRARRD